MVTARVAAVLKKTFAVDHATIQIETDPATLCEFESDKTVRGPKPCSPSPSP